MPTYICNHCGKEIKNNGGSAKEIGMFWADNKTYCWNCGSKILISLLRSEGLYDE